MTANEKTACDSHPKGRGRASRGGMRKVRRQRELGGGNVGGQKPLLRLHGKEWARWGTRARGGLV